MLSLNLNKCISNIIKLANSNHYGLFHLFQKFVFPLNVETKYWRHPVLETKLKSGEPLQLTYALVDAMSVGFIHKLDFSKVQKLKYVIFKRQLLEFLKYIFLFMSLLHTETYI